MICRKCKRVITLNELNGYACGHLITLAIAAGFAAYLGKAIADYFLNPTRGFVDETMAGVSNGLGMACPKCKNAQIWDPLPEANQQPKIKSQRSKKKQQVENS